MNLDQFNFHHLLYFWRVAKSGHLTRAAQEMHISQSALSAQIREEDFDFEAACNLLMVLSRIDRAELHLTDLDDQVTRVAERFAVSRTTCELLCGALRGDMAGKV